MLEWFDRVSHVHVDFLNILSHHFILLDLVFCQSWSNKSSEVTIFSLFGVLLRKFSGKELYLLIKVPSVIGWHELRAKTLMMSQVSVWVSERNKNITNVKSFDYLQGWRRIETIIQYLTSYRVHDKLQLLTHNKNKKSKFLILNWTFIRQDPNQRALTRCLTELKDAKTTLYM